MKDGIMPQDQNKSLGELSNQEVEEKLGKAIHRALKLAGEAERRLCDASEFDQNGYGIANAEMTEACGYLKLAKSHATKAGLSMPDITVKFGGK